MAEVLGTVVGVVSLGLQVCAGINTYLDGVQCHKQDLEHTARCCKSMEALLKQIEILQIRISEVTGASKTTIENAMAAAKAELSLLDEFVEEICTRKTSTSSRSAMERIKDQQRKFLYPFRKDHLYRLNDRLETANRVLHSALQLAELEISLGQGQALQGLQDSLDSLTRGVSHMHLEMNTAVRQLHSRTTASHLALDNIQKTSDETTSLVTVSHKDTVSFREDLSEMKTMLVALMSSDARAILPKLVSKPDALKKISDMVGSGSPDKGLDLPIRYEAKQTLNSRVYPEFQCICNPRQVLRGRRRRLGLAFMEQERVTDNMHVPRCPLACFCVQSYDKWSFGISVKALERILHAGLTISMSATFGAGGFGLSPSFTYFHVRGNSPALQVVSILESAFYRRVWSDEEADHLFRRSIKTLQATMTARKWSPFDVFGQGHCLLKALSGIPGESGWQGNRIKLLAFFLSLGAPRDRPDDHGFFPLHLFLYFMNGQQEFAEAFDLLWADEVPLMKHGLQLAFRGYTFVDRMENYKAAVNISAKMRKLYENHLMQAIIQKSKPMLVDIIEKDLITSDLSDMDAFGYKMLHYLLGWPEGLRLVVEQCGNSVLQLDDQRHILLLECALKWSGKVCKSSNWEYCSRGCACAEAVQTLLEAETGYAPKLRGHDHWVLAMLSALAKAGVLVISDLKRRRQELKELGLLHLSFKQIDRMDLRKSKVLDYHTAEVLQALKTMGIVVPARLETEMKVQKEDGGLGDYSLGPKTHEPGSAGQLSSNAASVYHMLGAYNILEAPLDTGSTNSMRALASSLYSHGFHDIDVPDCAGMTPLIKRHEQYVSGHYMPWYWNTSIEYWLLEHGASLGTEVSGGVTGYIAAHHVFRCIGSQSGCIMGSRPFQLIHSSWESEFDSTQRILDACRCKCSIGGCSPYNTMWKMLLETFALGWRPSWHQWSRSSDLGHRGDQRKDSRHEDRQQLINFILEETLLLEEAFELPQPVKCICLRACTFEMLPLRHTCCDGGHHRCDDEEISEVWEEDQTDIGRLEDLIDEFEKKLEEMDCGLTEFYRDYWIDRMSEVLRQMDEQILTATEMEGVERLGVTLMVETETSGLEEEEIEDMNSLEFWVQRIDALVE